MQAVGLQFGADQRAVMVCGWNGDRGRGGK